MIARDEIFLGVHRNYFFIAITLIEVGGQILIIYVGGTAFSVTRINGVQWATSIILGLLSLPFGALLRLIPNKFFNWFNPHSLWHGRPRTRIVDEEIVLDEWNPATADARVLSERLQSEGRPGGNEVLSGRMYD